MNTSFSKRRHILEANLVAEKRFLTEKNETTILNEQVDIYQVANLIRMELEKTNTNEENVLKYLKQLGNFENFKKFLDIYERNYGQNSLGRDLFDAFKGAEGISLSDTFKSIGINRYDLNNGSYNAVKSNLSSGSVPGGNNTTAPAASATKKRLQYKDCSKATSFGYLCADTRPEEQNPIKKVQRCLGLKKVDGYFGGDTLKALNDKFADKKGVFTINDVATICQTKPSGSAYQAEDSEINPAIATQTQPEVVTPAQSLQPKQGAQVKSQQQIAAPKIQISAQQRDRLSKEWQTQVEKVKGENPGLNNQEIVNLLASRGIKYPEALRQQPVRA